MTSDQYLHPQDIGLFTEVVAAMRVVARKYSLPLGSIEPMPNPTYEKSALGDCLYSGGHIRLTLRAKVNGDWDVTPRDRDAVWKTAAHELAHLKHPNHGLLFQEFEEELHWAMTNQEEDPKQKLIGKIIKMQGMKEGFDRMGSSAEAEAFADKINRLMIEHELQPTDLDYAAGSANDPIIEMRADLPKYGIAASQMRVAWQENLALIVANAHLCQILIVPRTNNIIFVGTKSHCMAAEYAYGTLVPSANLLSDKEAYYYRLQCRKEGQPKKANGFREAWLGAFVQRIGERMQEAREDAVKRDAERRAARGEAGNTGTALIRLSGALRRVQEHIDGRFHRKRRWASQLNGGRQGHAEGRERGRAAADQMNIGRKGVNGSGGNKGLLV